MSTHYDDPAYAPTQTSLPPVPQFIMDPTTNPATEVIAPPMTVYVREPKNGFGITAFICGIAGAICGLIPILSVPALAAGLIGFGFGMGGVKRLRSKRADNKVMTILGVIVSVLAVVLGVIGMIIVQHAVDQLQTDLNNIDATYNTK
jgi:predicted PurR-regulated permease PerM